MAETEIVSAAEYKAKSRKLITLPSGAVFEIKKISPFDFVEFSGEIKEGMSEEEMAKIIAPKFEEYGAAFICSGVSKPRIRNDVSSAEVGDEELHITDIDKHDLTALIKEITEFSGLDEVTAELEGEKRKSFRNAPDSKGSGGTGTESS